MVKKVDRARLADARHEAAHAVTAWLLGHRCRVTLVPDGLNRATCIVAKPCPRRDDALISLAALLESCQDDPLFWTLIDGSTDLVNVITHANELAPDDPGRWFVESYVQVRFILQCKRARRAIDTLARALVEATTLDEDAVDRIIAEAFTARETTPRR